MISSTCVGQLKNYVLREHRYTYEDDPYYDTYGDGDWYFKTNRLAVCNNDGISYLSNHKSLVKYLWSDIEKGIYDNQTELQIHVSDFCIQNDDLVVLETNGRLSVAGKWKNAILKRVEARSWTCVQSVDHNLLCAKLMKGTSALYLLHPQQKEIPKFGISIQLSNYI